MLDATLSDACLSAAVLSTVISKLISMCLQSEPWWMCKLVDQKLCYFTYNDTSSSATAEKPRDTL